MKGLGARLRRTLGEAGDASSAAAPTPEPPAPGLDLDGLARHARLQARMSRWAEANRDLPALEETVGGQARTTPHGDAWVVRRPHSAVSWHGERRLGALFERTCDHLAGLVGDARLEGFDPSKALFLDIEASGLDHGAGTLAFLIGLGYLDGDDVVVEQLLLREPNDEQAQLHLLVEALERHPFLVSFNGKSYDLTVLQSRLVLNRFYTSRECDLKLRPHLDLLHVSRNLYKGLWEDTRLGTLERRALGFERVDDIPGSLVPTCWYHWLRSGNPEPLAAVVEHNLYDVLSMVTLADRVAHDSDLGTGEAAERDAAAAVNLARLLLRRKDAEGAARVLEPLARSAVDAALAPVLAALAEARRRLGDAAGEREALERLVEASPRDLQGLTRLAMVLERARELEAALAVARRAHEALPTSALGQRIARLEARLARAREG